MRCTLLLFALICCDCLPTCHITLLLMHGHFSFITHLWFTFYFTFDLISQRAVASLVLLLLFFFLLIKICCISEMKWKTQIDIDNKTTQASFIHFLSSFRILLAAKPDFAASRNFILFRSLSLEYKQTKVSFVCGNLFCAS